MGKMLEQAKGEAAIQVCETHLGEQSTELWLG